MNDPLIQLLRAEFAIKIQRVLVPIQGRPFKPSAVALHSDLRHCLDQFAPDATPAKLWTHIKVLEPYTRAAHETGKRKKINCIAGQLTIASRQQRARYALR